MKRSEYQFEVELEQITPYVNEIDVNKNDKKREEIFRTTEFKPRFDKFLINKYNSDKLQNYFLKKNSDNDKREALNYKVFIQSNKEYIDKYKVRKEHDAMKTSGQKYYAREEGITFRLVFFSFYPELIKILQENLAEFLAITNFGKRKNKGYGSFYISETDSMYKDIDEINKLQKFKYFKDSNSYLELTLSKNNNLEFLKKLNGVEIDVQIRGRKTVQPAIILRKEKYRKESLAIMKILRKKDKYRLYIIPNYEVIEAIKSVELGIIEDIKNKSFKEFDLNKFLADINGR